MTIAYLINQYPQPSQSFIRREIAALESLGVNVRRYTLRRWDSELVDASDRSEQEKTRVVLHVGAMGLLLAVVKTLLTRPGAMWRAMRLTWRLGFLTGRGMTLHLIYLAEACVLRSWFQADGVQHVHAHFGTNSTTVAMLCRALGGPSYSFTAHGPEEFDRPEFLALGEKIDRAAFVVAISQFGRSQLFRWCDPRQSWDKIHVVRCGVSDDFLAHPPTPIDAAPRLVNVGRLGGSKGQLILVEAAAKLAAQGVDFELVLIGDGPLRSLLEERISHHGLQGRVILAGWKSGPQVRQQLLDSRALVLPSFAEGLPVAIMEALALRRPVITTRIAGIPELVQDGVNGWLVPAGAVDELVETMRHALSLSPQELYEAGQRGAAAVAAQHNVKTEAEKLLNLFRLTRNEGELS